MDRAPRAEVLALVADEIRALRRRPIARIAIDGVDGAGKTTFADELAALLDEAAIRASVDDFHRPRALRYAKGRHSPEGFFEDSFDYVALKAVLLEPLSADPPERFRTACFDHRADAQVQAQLESPAGRRFLIFDGIFAHRPELIGYWDYSVFLDVSPAVSVRRCIDRDGSSDVPDDPEHAMHARYVKGQALYLERCDPAARCTRHILNEDLEIPALVG